MDVLEEMLETEEVTEDENSFSLSKPHKGCVWHC